MKSVELEEQRDRLEEERQELVSNISESRKYTEETVKTLIEVQKAHSVLNKKYEALEIENGKFLNMQRIHDEDFLEKSELIKEQKIALSQLGKSPNIIINNKIEAKKDWFSILKEAVFYVTIISIISSFLSVLFSSCGCPKTSNVFYCIHRSCTLLIFILKNLPILLQDPKTFPQKLIAITFLYFQNELTKNNETLPTHLPISTSPSSSSISPSLD